MELKKLTKKLTTLAITALMATALVPTQTNVSAASKTAQKKANKAYAQAIKKNKVAKFTEYALLEVTGGGTKELIVKNTSNKAKGKARNLNIYTYNKGKVKKIWSTSDQALTYNKKNKTIIDLQMGGGDEGGSAFAKYDIYKYNGKKIVKIATYSFEQYGHVEDDHGNKLTYTEMEDEDINFHTVIDKQIYRKKANGKTKKITKKQYENAIRYDVGVWTEYSITRKDLIKKLSK